MVKPFESGEASSKTMQQQQQLDPGLLDLHKLFKEVSTLRRKQISHDIPQLNKMRAELASFTADGDPHAYAEKLRLLLIHEIKNIKSSYLIVQKAKTISDRLKPMADREEMRTADQCEEIWKIDKSWANDNPPRDVAAFVNTEGSLFGWVHAKLEGYDASTDRYTVRDADTGQSGGKTCDVSATNVIPLDPQRATEVPKRMEFAIGESVLAQYPMTTAFYRAKVVCGPVQNKARGDSPNGLTYYLLRFEDDQDTSTNRDVCRRVLDKFVIPSRNGTKEKQK